MMLAIDCGNSRIKWATFEAGRRCGQGAAGLRGGEDPFALLAAALKPGTDRVSVANVAGADVARQITATIESGLGIAPEFVSVEPKAHGIECGYRDPATLGVDRWLAMIAARRSVDGPFVVVSAGTAVTFDAVDAGGLHLGGLIFPGIRTIIGALAKNAEQIPLVGEVARPASGVDLLGRSTEQGVSRGARLAIAAGVDRAIGQVADSLAARPQVLVTGGDAAALAEWLASDVTVRADLVLDGLAAIAANGE